MAENAPCLFCNDPVAIDGEGYMGVMIGKRMICEGCLQELHDVLHHPGHVTIRE